MSVIPLYRSLPAAILSSTLLLSACGDERNPQLADTTGSQETNTAAVTAAVPRTVCGVDPASDEVRPGVVIDNSNEPVVVHSVAQAANDLTESIQTQVSDPFTQIAYLQIPAQMAGTAMADAVFLFSGMYQCTPELLRDNGCSWEMPAGDGDGNLYVSTALGHAQAYKTDVRRGLTADSAVLMMSLEGVVGDAGNLLVTLQADDGSDQRSIRTTERSNRGDEHITFSSGLDLHSASENADCSGSLEMNYDGYRMKASWNWANNRTTGHVLYNAGKGDIQLSW